MEKGFLKQFGLKNFQTIQLIFFMVEILLHLGVPDNQILLHFGVPDNQILVRFGVPDNQILLHLVSPTTALVAQAWLRGYIHWAVVRDTKME